MNLEDAEDQRRALAVPCPSCFVDVDQLCQRSDGSELERAPAHIARLHAAGVVHAPLDSRDLRRG